jgi:D-alanyl-D-alanine carboxypeptidase (penicillin-binding protein 5/6)
MKKLCLVIMAFLFATSGVYAEEALAENAKSAILIDAASGEVLYEKNANEKLPMASMTNIMTT